MNDEDFFRHCWLTLKNSKPRLRKFMDKIECSIEGAGRVIDDKPSRQKESKERSNDTPDPDQPERHIV